MLGCLDRSPWIVHFNCNSCNGCDIEVLACLTPLYDVERFGVLHVGNPKHADILVVTGSVNHRNAPVLRHVWEQMPEPRLVVALGACGATGGIFATGYNVLGGIDKVIPVDVWVPGCPPRPEAIIDGILEAVTLWKQRGAGFVNGQAPKWRVTRTPTPAPAAPKDPPASPKDSPASPAPSDMTSTGDAPRLSDAALSAASTGTLAAAPSANAEATPGAAVPVQDPAPTPASPAPSQEVPPQ